MSTIESLLRTSIDTNHEFLADVQIGLSKAQKQLSCKYFYDQRGSQLFDAICELDEYYPTRTEIQIMKEHAADMVNLLQEDVMLIEFGSGSSMKTTILLDECEKMASYLPVDVSREHLLMTAKRLRQQYPHFPIHPVCADFTRPFDLPKIRSKQRVVYFPGSTIGNLTNDQAHSLLVWIRELIGEQGGLLLGMDMIKDRQTVENAYNDAKGVTAEFNLNLLRRINRELNADFCLDQFEHVAFWNDAESRIEMHLKSKCQQSVHLGERIFDFEVDETICTEYSHKYDETILGDIILDVGFSIHRSWFDAKRWFGIFYLQATG